MKTFILADNGKVQEGFETQQQAFDVQKELLEGLKREEINGAFYYGTDTQLDDFKKKQLSNRTLIQK